MKKARGRGSHEKGRRAIRSSAPAVVDEEPSDRYRRGSDREERGLSKPRSTAARRQNLHVFARRWTTATTGGRTTWRVQSIQCDLSYPVVLKLVLDYSGGHAKLSPKIIYLFDPDTLGVDAFTQRLRRRQELRGECP